MNLGSLEINSLNVDITNSIHDIEWVEPQLGARAYHQCIKKGLSFFFEEDDELENLVNRIRLIMIEELDFNVSTLKLPSTAA